MAAPSTGASKSPEVLEIKLTEVLDVISFWAQIGTTKQFTAYDQQQKEMSAWCDKCSAGCHENSSSLKLESIVAVRGETNGTWVRAKVMKIIADMLVELLYVDTGVTDYADVRSICVQAPPMLCSIPQQALHCLLAGIELAEGENEWSKKANARFLELTSAHAKAVHHGTHDGNRITVSVFIPYKGKFMSVGEVLRLEGLAKYVAPGPLSLDIPVPREVVANDNLLEDSDIMPINCYITNSLLHQRQLARAASYANNQEQNLDASEAEDAKTIPENKEDILNSTSGNCGSPATPGDRVGIGTPSKSHPVDAVTPISAHPAESDVPRTPSREDAEQFEDIDDGLTSPTLLMAETTRRSHMGLPEMVAMKRAALQSVAEPPDAGKPGRDEAPQATPLPETKAVSQGDHTVEATSSTLNASNRKLSLSDSGSELSDNDWLDEDLLPRRSGNSEVSDVQLESPVKDLQAVTPEGAPPVTLEGGHMWDKSTPRHELFTRNHILDNSTAGNTPYPRRPQVQPYTHPYTSRSVRGPFQNTLKDNWSPRGPPKGRGKGKGRNRGEGGVKRSNSEDKEKHQGAMMLRGRGRGAREKFSHRNPAQNKPSLLEFPVVRPNDGRPPDLSISESQHDRPVGFAVRRPVTMAAENVPDHSTSENRDDHLVGFDVRRPTTVVENVSWPDRSSSEGQHDHLMGYSVRRPAVAEHSSSDSPQKLSSPAYSEKVKEMSDLETNHEVRWQEWRIEEGTTKILKSLSTENVDGFGEEVGKLICGTAAAKLRELSKYRNPLQIVVEYMIEKGVAKILAPSLFMSALENMVEGPDGAEVQKVWLNVIGRKASQVIESGAAELKLEEGSTKCQAFCWFLGALFCLPSSNSSKCREILIETVSCCLVIWTKLVPKDSDNSGKTEEQHKLDYERFERRCKLQVDCFGALLDGLYASPSVVALEEVVSLLLGGQVPECVLCEYYPRHVRQAWHAESVKVRKPPPPLEVPLTDQGTGGLQESIAAESDEKVVGAYSRVEWSQVQQRMEPNQLQGIESNQFPQQGVEDVQSHLGMELNQMQQGVEPRQSRQGMELNLVQQMNPGTDLNPDQGVMTYPPHSFSPQLPSSPAPTAHNSSPLSGDPSYPQYQMSQLKPDSYTRVMAMLESLHLTELFPKFTASMIKDPVLDCDDLMGVKDCLKDAGIPPGPVLQILYYLETSQKLGSMGRVQQQGQGYRARHATQMSNPAASTLVQRALYLPSSTASPSPTFSSQHPPGGVATAALLPSNSYVSGQQQQQQMVSSPYQVPLSDSTSSSLMYDAAPENMYSRGKPLTIYQMQPPPLGNKAAWMKKPPQQNALRQQVPQQNAPLQQQMPQQNAPLQEQMPQQNAPFQQQMPQQNAPLQQQMPQQNAPLQQQMPQQNAPLQQQIPQKNALQQQMPQQNALQQQMPQQNALQQQMLQRNALQQKMSQQNAFLQQLRQPQQEMQQPQPAVLQQQVRPRQQIQPPAQMPTQPRQQIQPPAQMQPSPTPQQQPQKTTLRQLLQRVNSLQQQQQPERAVQQQIQQPLSPPALVRQESTRVQPSPKQASGSKDPPAATGSGSGNLHSPVSVLNEAQATPTAATPPARSSEWDFNFPPLPVRKPRNSPAQLPADAQFQLPPTRPQISGFGRVNCVVCGGMDHMTPDCNQRSKFFTHM